VKAAGPLAREAGSPLAGLPPLNASFSNRSPERRDPAAIRYGKKRDRCDRSRPEVDRKLPTERRARARACRGRLRFSTRSGPDVLFGESESKGRPDASFNRRDPRTEHGDDPRVLLFQESFSYSDPSDTDRPSSAREPPPRL
jgi:hypothetical protein